MDFRRINLVDVEVCDEIPALTLAGPSRILVRVAGRPIGELKVTIPEEGLSAGDTGALLAPMVRRELGEVSGLAAGQAIPAGAGNPSPDMV